MGTRVVPSERLRHELDVLIGDSGELADPIEHVVGDLLLLLARGVGDTLEPKRLAEPDHDLGELQPLPVADLVGAEDGHGHDRHARLERQAPDAGPPDAGPPDAGPDPHRIGGLGFGPFPSGPLVIYGSSQGLLEAPISASVDESENLWVVSHSALYLLQPGAKVFRRYTAQDGLHFGPGYTESPDITLVEGGAKGECFVGYYARDTNSSMFKDAHMWSDPWAHMGKMDQVLLQPDGKLKVNRCDLRNSNDGHYYETRTIMSMVYDHFQHPGNLYVGSNHGENQQPYLVRGAAAAQWLFAGTGLADGDSFGRYGIEIDALIGQSTFHIGKAHQIHAIAQRLVDEHGDFPTSTSARI